MKKRMSKEERYNRIYTACEPFREAKKKTIHTLMSFGKKHPVLKYPMFVVTVLFIFVYNLFLHLFIQMQMRERLAMMNVARVQARTCLLRWRLPVSI